MTDIVERLRDPSRRSVGDDDAVMAEAADEIEVLRAEMDQAVKLAYSAVRAERAAILELIESYHADGHLYDGDYVLQTIAAAIRARGEWQ